MLGSLSEELLECPRALERGAELVAVLVRHTLQPVEPGGGPGRHTGKGRSGHDELGEERGAREGVRATSRPADDMKPLQVELAGDGGDVLHTARDRSTGPTRRAGVPRPRVGDELQASISNVGDHRLVGDTSAGRSDLEEHCGRGTVARPALESTPIGESEREVAVAGHVAMVLPGLRYHGAPMSSDRVTLQVVERPADQVGSRRVRRLRREGMIPGVLYGKGHARAILVGERELRTVLTGPSGLHAIVDVVVEGQKTPHHAVLKEFQRHPIRGTLTHVDFHEVRLDRPIQATVNVHFVGESPGAKQGGVVQQVARELRVEALPTAVPEHIEADISALEIGGTVRVADLLAIEGVAYLDDPETVLANCSIPRGITELEEAEAAELEEGEEAEGEAAEGEPSADASSEGSETDAE